MKHSFLDRYSDRQSFIHRLDPRTKFITAIIFILAVLLTPPGSWLAFVLFLVILAALLIQSRVPPAYVFRQSLIILPFISVFAFFIPFIKGGEVAASFNIWSWQIEITHSGTRMFLSLAIKSWLSIVSLTWLMSTTRLADLLQGLERMRLPRVMVMLMSFMYRYLFVLTDEVLRMKQARDSRSFGGGRLWQIRTTGNMVGTLFIRSYERGERVYAAMSARGFDGQTRTLNRLSFKLMDTCFVLGCSLVIVFIGVLVP